MTFRNRTSSSALCSVYSVSITLRLFQGSKTHCDVSQPLCMVLPMLIPTFRAVMRGWLHFVVVHDLLLKKPYLSLTGCNILPQPFLYVAWRMLDSSRCFSRRSKFCIRSLSFSYSWKCVVCIDRIINSACNIASASYVRLNGVSFLLVRGVVLYDHRPLGSSCI